LISSAFEYQRATSIDDAVAKLQAANGSGKLIAGGHSLVPLMKLRLSEPQVLIDIARIPGLSGIREASGGLEIGAGTVHSDIASSPLVREQCPALADAAAAIGDPQVRNRGTIGGSLAHADPTADYPAVMLAVDADLQISGARGTRTVRANGFFQDLFTVDLAPDEIITSIRCAQARVASYAKLYQRASHFAIVGVAAALLMNDGVIQSARIGLTGAGPHATRLSPVEAALAGQSPTLDVLRDVAALAGQDIEHVNADLHASAAYRRAMIPVFTRRALEGALARLGGS
jgi:aerobic carbon-monoxide dehydrogenase medium subunit